MPGKCQDVGLLRQAQGAGGRAVGAWCSAYVVDSDERVGVHMVQLLARRDQTDQHRVTLLAAAGGQALCTSVPEQDCSPGLSPSANSHGCNHTNIHH